MPNQCLLPEIKVLDICDEIRSAQVEWIIEHGKYPTQVLLPRSKYLELITWADEHALIYSFSGFCRKPEMFAGMRVYCYGGEGIVFSSESDPCQI